MKSPNKLVIGFTTATAIMAPFAPKTVNINFGEPLAIVAEAKSCALISTIIDDRGRRYCEYRCNTQMRIIPESTSSCEKSINEKLIK
jgi:hypothetical protein